MKYVVYRPSDGKILRVGSASTHSLMRLQAKEGEAVMAAGGLGLISTLTHAVVDGQIVRLQVPTSAARG